MPDGARFNVRSILLLSAPRQNRLQAPRPNHAGTRGRNTCAASGSGENLNMRKHALKLTSLIAMALAVTFLGPQRAAADDDDPPTRVARLPQAEEPAAFETTDT